MWIVGQAVTKPCVPLHEHAWLIKWIVCQGPGDAITRGVEVPGRCEKHIGSTLFPFISSIFIRDHQ